MDISVVIPVFGCPGAIPDLCRRLNESLTQMKVSYEIILVDDCDKMGSWEKVEAAARADSRVKAIGLARNSGQGHAITAGIAASKGDWIVTMDCDLQDAPEKIHILYDKVREENLDVVFVRRQKRKDPLITRAFSRLFHRIFSYLSQLPFDYELGTYLIASRRSADYFVRSKDRGRDFTMYLVWLGLPHAFVEFEHENRFEGKSSYTFARKWKYAVGVMTTFSNKILDIPIRFGLFCAFLSLLYIIYALVQYFAFNGNPEGWTTLAAAVFFFGGLILSTLGIIGVYLGNVFDVTKDRPLYIVRETINLEEDKG